MVSQVVVRPSGGAAAVHIDQVDGPGGRRVVKGKTLHLGSQDLIRFAGYATKHGFRVMGFMIADSHFSPAPDDEQAAVSADMVGILKEYGAKELESAMSDDFAGYFVTGVQLLALNSGMRLTVRRSGFVETSVVAEAETFINRAWRTLRLT